MNAFWPLIDTQVDNPQRANVPIGLEYLFELLLPPPGMRAVQVFYEPLWRTVHFIVEHPDLPPVRPGELLPTLRPTYTTQAPAPAHFMVGHWDLSGNR